MATDGGRHGRPPKRPEERRRNLCVSFYEPQMERLREEAARRGTTVSALLRELVDQLLPAEVSNS